MGQIRLAFTNVKPSLHLQVFSLIYLSQTSCRICAVAKYAVTKSLDQLSWEGRVDHVSYRQADHQCAAGSAKMAISNIQLVCAVAVVAIATFINLPAPRFSKRLEEWRIMGQYFNYKGNAIFYQGEAQWSSLDIGARISRSYRPTRILNDWMMWALF